MITSLRGCPILDETKVYLPGIEAGKYLQDKQAYLEYKKNKIDLEYKNNDMEVLMLLENLGYPTDEVGTYLYKYMILKISEYLETGLTIRQEPITKDQLELEINNLFSQFYLDIARNELDMGIKTFHNYISVAVSKINYENLNTNLFYEIFGNNSKDINYAEQAFLIATYVIENKQENKKTSPMTRQLKKDMLKEVTI